MWTAPERERARAALAPLAPTVRIMSDVEAAYLGALGTGAGVLLLAGTGSIALGRDAAGRWHRAGGLGPLLGDEGSAFWIGRAWLRATDRGAIPIACVGWPPRRMRWPASPPPPRRRSAPHAAVTAWRAPSSAKPSSGWATASSRSPAVSGWVAPFP